MNRLFKTLLIGLLALTLPVHVIAATLMPMMQAMIQTQANAAIAQDEHAHHAGHHVDTVPGAQTHSSGLGSPPDHQGHDMKHCASCGACCMTALMANLDVLPAVHPQTLIVQPFFSLFLPGPIPHRLDRPPRISLV